MDIFELKSIKPMLIKDMQEPFNSVDYIYELKFDGVRCIAYLDESGADLRNKRNMALISKYPELININKQVNNKCILDGELIVYRDNGPDFYEMQRRTILTDKFKIQMAAKNYPVCFVAFDILYYIDKDITDQPLMIRKSILESTLQENPRIVISRFISEYGVELYKTVEERKLEGVVAKRKDSLYWQDKRSRDWIKFKRLFDEDFVICGYIRKHPMNVLLLGQYEGDRLVYKGSVSLGVRLNYLLSHYNLIPIAYSPFSNKIDENGPAVWLLPGTVCTVEYMPGTKDSLRQPVFKGILSDKNPIDCQVGNA